MLNAIESQEVQLALQPSMTTGLTLAETVVQKLKEVDERIVACTKVMGAARHNVRRGVLFVVFFGDRDKKKSFGLLFLFDTRRKGIFNALISVFVVEPLALRDRAGAALHPALSAVQDHDRGHDADPTGGRVCAVPPVADYGRRCERAGGDVVLGHVHDLAPWCGARRGTRRK